MHEPDRQDLIGFLKAMEFTSLTRRAAAISGSRSGCDCRGAIAANAPPRCKVELPEAGGPEANPAHRRGDPRSPIDQGAYEW